MGILNVQQGLVTCFMSANQRGTSRTKGELMRMLLSDHCSLLLMGEVRSGALQHKGCSWLWLSMIFQDFPSCLVLVGSTEQGAERKLEYRHW